MTMSTRTLTTQVSLSMTILDEIPALLKEYNEIGVKALKDDGDPENALESLKRCE